LTCLSKKYGKVDCEKLNIQVRVNSWFMSEPAKFTGLINFFFEKFSFHFLKNLDS